MADDDKKPKRAHDDWARELIEIVLVLAILMALVGSVGNFFKNLSSPISGFSLGNIFNLGNPLSSLIGQFKPPASNAVGFKDGSALLDAPGGRQIRTLTSADKATIIGNPIYKDGVRYWPVRLADGTEGFVAESSLTGPDGGGFDPGKTPVGDPVSFKKGSALFDEP